MLTNLQQQFREDVSCLRKYAYEFAVINYSAGWPNSDEDASNTYDLMITSQIAINSKFDKLYDGLFNWHQELLDIEVPTEYETKLKEDLYDKLVQLGIYK